MQQAFHRALRSACAIAILLVATTSAALAAPAFTLSRSGGVAPGDTLQVSIAAEDVTDLFAYQFTLAFNPALLQATTSVEGPFLATGGPTFFGPGLIDNVGGTVSFVFDTLLSSVPGVSGSGLLARVDFTALTEGISRLTLMDVIALDSNGNTFAVGTSPLVVPEPASMGLLALGALALGAMRRRKPAAR